ncbi:parathyroid hormone/parathyroid hormone-related peptide receptor-like [Saccostrea echinata]|uniref:parathyroid hormone/parathyroid hormone-related peptide receptor-like n=1 Tax=Saccostrea echinata TaxID=191078 RepID=UPI002A82B20D|nr:parathyroid hormone/parathyroid hormone-related peptide receptor-like [Saccostrea echinata]
MSSIMERKEYRVSLVEQLQGMKEAEDICNATIQKHGPTTDLLCPPVWDHIMCWRSAKAGTTVSAPCPSYIDRFLVNGVAKRTCTIDGTWYINPHTNSTWTNFTYCMESENSRNLLKKNLNHIQTISLAGYTLSIVSLIIAVIMLLRHRHSIGSNRPRSKITTLHLNLFIAYGLRYITSLLMEHVFSSSTIKQQAGEITELQIQNSHWGCKLTMTSFVYTLLASTVWLSVDASVLVWMICCNPLYFQKRNNIFPHLLIGWGGPLFIVIPWVSLRSLLDDEMCWMTIDINNYESWEAWLFLGPVLIINSVNIVYLFLIGRFVRKNHMMKKTSSNSTELFRRHYSRPKEHTITTILNTARLVCILIPLLGVPDIILTILSFWPNIHYLYADMIFSSFQGFMLAVSLCLSERKAVQDFRSIALPCRKLTRRVSRTSSTGENTSVNT